MMNKKHDNLILIFTRNPELGKVKTRLAKTVGNQTALDIYRFLLEKTQQVTRLVNADKAVYYSVKVRNNDIWDTPIYTKHQQVGLNLGERMLHAFETSFKEGYKKVLIIGSDLYDLTPDLISSAFSALSTSNFVIGPATDGGYYLLGMTALEKSIFKNKQWGTASVRKDTLEDLKNKTIFLLPELNDIDVFDDIKDHNAFTHFIKKQPNG